MNILGIETSCDETAAAIVSSDKRILANIVLSQIEEHMPYGGVVPEIAARAHIQHIDNVIAAALKEAGMGLEDVDAIAATAGPGLIGGVMVGLMMAKGLCLATGKPLYAVNHLEGHALTARLVEDVPFPYLMLLVSGGHCQLLIVEGVGRYIRLGGTKDDALGEAFDKVAKMLGMGYPGGPQVEQRATLGDATRFIFPRPLKGDESCDFSFSGLKTSISRQVAALRNEGTLDDKAISDICAAFQHTVADVLEDRITRAAALFRKQCQNGQHIVVAGGVAANRFLKNRLEECVKKQGLALHVPPVSLCTDNAAMIAWAAHERIMAGKPADSLAAEPKARWPLTANAKK